MDDSTSYNRFTGKSLMCVCYRRFTILIAFKCHYVFHLKFQIAQECHSLPYYLHTIVSRYIEGWWGLANVERAILSKEAVHALQSLAIFALRSITHKLNIMSRGWILIGCSFECGLWKSKEFAFHCSCWTKMWHFFFCANVTRRVRSDAP